MPQRVNAKSDIGNSKLASDVYDTNNIFLTDQGWVYRHWKGDPATTKRYWDEILVAGKVDPELYPGGTGSDFITPTLYDGTGQGSQKYTNDELSMYEPTPGNIPGTPDGKFDVEYSKHTELQADGTLKEFGDPDDYKPEDLKDTDGNVLPPPLPQYPEIEGYETPGYVAGSGFGFTAQAIDGYFPLYTTATAANLSGDGTHHTHTFNGTTYYMPNGVTFYHGDYSG